MSFKKPSLLDIVIISLQVVFILVFPLVFSFLQLPFRVAEAQHFNDISITFTLYFKFRACELLF